MPNSASRTFADPYEFQKSIRAADMRVLVTTPGVFKATLSRIDLHHLWMQRGWASLPTLIHSTVHKSRSPIFFLTDVHQAPILHTGIEVSPGDIVFYSPGAEHHRRMPARSHWGAMSLTPQDLATYGRAIAGRDLTAPSVTRFIRPASTLIFQLWNLHKAAADLAATAPEILAHPEVAKAIEQQLIRTMILCLTGPEAATSPRPGPQRLLIMRRFEDMLEANPDRPLYMSEICAEIGVTDRTLRLHCQEHLGMSPHRYLWLRRMHLARRALALADGTMRTVTEIANDHGFGELGHFAVAYRQLFGESPSVTLRRPPDDLRPTRYRLVQ